MRFSLFIHIARRIVFSQQIAAERRAYKQQPTHTTNGAGRALQELSQGIAGIDRHLANAGRRTTAGASQGGCGHGWRASERQEATQASPDCCSHLKAVSQGLRDDAIFNPEDFRDR